MNKLIQRIFISSKQRDHGPMDEMNLDSADFMAVNSTINEKPVDSSTFEQLSLSRYRTKGTLFTILNTPFFCFFLLLFSPTQKINFFQREESKSIP